MSQLKNIKITTPTYDEEIPSTRKACKIEPFKVGDEKTLLIASEAGDNKQMINALKSVISNCSNIEDVDSLAAFDLEYLFVKIRSVSVGEESKVGVKCNSCEANNEVSIDLSTIEVLRDIAHKPTIRITDTLGFEMKYTNIDDVGNVNPNNVDEMLEIIARSVKTVFSGDETISVGEDEIEDLKGILDSLTTKQFDNIQEFFTTAPKIQKQINFTCKECSEVNDQTLEGLASFF